MEFAYILLPYPTSFWKTVKGWVNPVKDSMNEKDKEAEQLRI